MIKVSNLTVRFGKIKALADLSITINKGECILLAGANGSGKTTLLRTLAGVLVPRGGDIMIDDCEVGPETREKTAYIPSSLGLYNSLKLNQAVALHASFYPGFRYREIGDFTFAMNRKISDLSKGEKTLFFLSLALSTSPDYLLLDDVIHFLDPYLRDIFLKTVLQLIEEKQLSIIIAAQTAADIEGILERVVVLDKGKIVLDDSVESLKQTFARIYTDEKEIPADLRHLPVVFQRDWEGMKELYVYPLPENRKPGTNSGLRLEYLALSEILKAFIGGEYDARRA